MATVGVPLLIAHVAVCGIAILLLARAGRIAARWLHQPEVIGEIAAGLFVGPVAMWLIGADAFHRLLPDDVMSVLNFLAETGLVLFLVGTTHKLRVTVEQPNRRAVGWVTIGALLPSLLAGAGLAGWVLLSGDRTVRGAASSPSFILFVAVSLSVTAVPVLARIISDRGMTDSSTGHLALTSAMVVDTTCWTLLTVALALNSGNVIAFLRSMGVLGCCALAGLVLRRVLRGHAARVFCSRLPTTTAILIGIAALTVAMSVARLGLTAVFGAILVGLAIPMDQSTPWAAAVSSVTKVGQALIPIFFVTTGVTVLVGAFGSASWTLIALATGLGILAKLTGGYAGARLGGEPNWPALRIGTLMNTRGLTELVVLQVGYSAGVLTGPLFLAMVVMALVTTALSGPLLLLIDRAESMGEVPTSGAARIVDPVIDLPGR